MSSSSSVRRYLISILVYLAFNYNGLVEGFAQLNCNWRVKFPPLFSLASNEQLKDNSVTPNTNTKTVKKSQTPKIIRIANSEPQELLTSSNEEISSSSSAKPKNSSKRTAIPITHSISGTSSLYGTNSPSSTYSLPPANHAYPSGSSDGQVSFTVYGEPIPLQRHMLSQGRMYNPSSTQQRNFERVCHEFLAPVPMQGPLEATLTFYFSRPISHYRTGKFAGQLKANMPLFHSKRKDLDNLIKFVLDSLNGVAYDDDAQVAVLNCAKFYTCGEPRTEVRLRHLPSAVSE